MRTGRPRAVVGSRSLCSPLVNDTGRSRTQVRDVALRLAERERVAETTMGNPDLRPGLRRVGGEERGIFGAALWSWG